jgi:hypothetical protein
MKVHFDSFFLYKMLSKSTCCFAFNGWTMLEKMEYGWIPSFSKCNQINGCYLFLALHEILKICHIFYGIDVWFDDIWYGVYVSFEKMICFSWFGKFSINNVSLFSTTNLVVVNSILSQSTFYNADTKCIHKINLNNLNEHFLCFKRSCQVEYVSFYDISIIAKGENNNNKFIYWFSGLLIETNPMNNI